MINPKELRIGNLVLLGTSTNAVLGVDAVSSFNIHIGDDYYGEDEIAPIPITPEWLERLGFFKYHRGDLGLGLGYFELEFSTEKGLLYLGCNEYEDALSHIKSVHQLQNLYFALTGEELTIRPE